MLELRLILKAIVARRAAHQLAALPVVEDAGHGFACNAGHGGEVGLLDLLTDGLWRMDCLGLAGLIPQLQQLGPILCEPAAGFSKDPARRGAGNQFAAREADFRGKVRPLICTCGGFFIPKGTRPSTLDDVIWNKWGSFDKSAVATNVYLLPVLCFLIWLPEQIRSGGRPFSSREWLPPFACRSGRLITFHRSVPDASPL
jgi:hypothetical protein